MEHVYLIRGRYRNGTVILTVSQDSKSWLTVKALKALKIKANENTEKGDGLDFDTKSSLKCSWTNMNENRENAICRTRMS